MLSFHNLPILQPLLTTPSNKSLLEDTQVSTRGEGGYNHGIQEGPRKRPAGVLPTCGTAAGRNV